jgi:hypothetical protein
VLLAGASLGGAPALHAQETGRGEHTEEIWHRHTLSISGGLAVFTDAGARGGALGLSYAYRLAERWAVGLKLEYADSELERDFIVLPGVGFEAAENLEFGVGVGVEQARKDEIEEGELKTVDETEALLRLTVAYAFPIGKRTALSPEFNSDFTASGVTYVYSLVFSVGL